MHTSRRQADEVAGYEATQVRMLAYAVLRNPTASGTDPRAVQPVALAVEAESVAYLIGAAHGMETTTGYTLPYVATWAGGKDPAATVRATAERVVRTARTILDTLPTEHGLGGQPPAVNRRTLEPADRPARPIPALTPSAAAGVSR